MGRYCLTILFRARSNETEKQAQRRLRVPTCLPEVLAQPIEEQWNRIMRDERDSCFLH
jgi:hypothetical protein